MNYQPADQRPGEIVVARIHIPNEDRMAAGKARPVVLVNREGPTWTVMGITTRSHYKTSGTPRVPIPNWDEVGLTKRSYLWGRTVRVSSLDIDRHIGWADAHLVASIIVTAGLSVEEATTLIARRLLAAAA